MSKYQIEIRVYDPKKDAYRRSVEHFRSRKKAGKRYARLEKLHSPEWQLSLGNVSGGLFNNIIEYNYPEHALWKFEEYGIESKSYNLDAIRRKRDQEALIK